MLPYIEYIINVNTQYNCMIASLLNAVKSNSGITGTIKSPKEILFPVS